MVADLTPVVAVDAGDAGMALFTTVADRRSSTERDVTWPVGCTCRPNWCGRARGGLAAAGQREGGLPHVDQWAQEGRSMSLEELFERPQFSIPQEEKEDSAAGGVDRLDRRSTGQPVSPMPASLNAVGVGTASSLPELPYLPVSLFKTHYLSSVLRSRCSRR